jgi:hypothetical protein
MSLSGLEPSNRGPSYRFRQAAKLFVEKGFGFYVDEIEAKTAFSFWSGMKNTKDTSDNNIAAINSELARAYNLRLLNSMNLAQSQELLVLHPEKLFRTLLDRGIPHSRLKSAVREMHASV